MTAAHWIAIAAIITPFITSWLQFWLKERSEQAKLTTASPAALQPSLVTQVVAKQITFWEFLRRSWLRIVIQWTLNLTAVFLLVCQYRSNFPLTRHSAVFISLTASLWAYFSLMFFIFDEKFPIRSTK